MDGPYKETFDDGSYYQDTYVDGKKNGKTTYICKEYAAEEKKKNEERKKRTDTDKEVTDIVIQKINSIPEIDGVDEVNQNNTKHQFNDDIRFPVFNSIVNHPEYGDEGQFIHIRALGGEQWSRNITIQDGMQYEVEVFYKNDALPKYNNEENNYCSVATKTTMAISVPSKLSGDGKIIVKITSLNSQNEAIDEISLIAPNDDNRTINWILGSGKIYNKWKSNEQILPSWLFSYPEGALLGCNEVNGIIPGGDDYSGKVRFFLK